MRWVAPFEMRRFGLGMLLSGILIWRVIDISLNLNPQYLLFVCYAANLALCIGIFTHSAILIGAGLNWLILALPLWFYDSILNNDWSSSGFAFHIAGPIAGGIVIRDYHLPRHTWILGISLGIVLQTLARLFTDQELNINSAYRIYKGWERIYPTHAIFNAAMLVGFSIAFFSFTQLHNRYFRSVDFKR